MILVKSVVFAALVVALAVNVVAWRRGQEMERAQNIGRTHHEQNPPACALDPEWQCHNTIKYHACKLDDQRLIDNKAAI